LSIDRLERRLIVSCRPLPGGPMDRPEIVVAFALAALAGGAAGVRIEGARNVAAVRAATDAPIIGLVRRDLATSPVRITPYLADVVALAAAGADVIAYDATLRPRPTPAPDIVRAIRLAGRVAMAECSSVADGRAAITAGAEILGASLAGGSAEPRGPDLALLGKLRRLAPRVIAEGRVRRPEQAAEALRRGAWAVVVGAALTCTEEATGWFADAMASARAPGLAARG